jgi:hypothetical protein
MRALRGQGWRDRHPISARPPARDRLYAVPSPTPTPPPSNRYTRVPSDAELSCIPLVEPTVLEISDRETVKLRRRLYRLNKDNAIWRYRTMRENGLTLLWRLTR